MIVSRLNLVAPRYRFNSVSVTVDGTLRHSYPCKGKKTNEYTVPDLHGTSISLPFLDESLAILRPTSPS